MKEHFLVQSQFAFFFKNSLDRPDELIPALNLKLGGIFDQIPTILPVPAQKGLEDVPIATLRSTGSQYACNLARSRVDFFCNGKGKQDFEPIKADFKNKISQLFSFLSEKKITIRRIGFLTQFLIIDEKPDVAVAELFSRDFKSMFPEQLHEARLRFTTRENIQSDIIINNVIQLGRGVVSRQTEGAKEEQKGLLLHRDFNTLTETDYSEKISSALIEKLFDHGIGNFKLADIKSKLWPV